MEDLDERLVTCFAAVFPNRPREEILSASRETIGEWDSLASVTLLSVIQQEFKTDIDLFDLDSLGSFSQLRDHLRGNAASA